ncbi:MAG: ADP-ribosylglycohydrolase family protein [Deltaproteobacteria bacterium]|nr:ADP-ribosylglycohydrolase family protein [Deltaproteobacteria bacterium]
MEKSLKSGFMGSMLGSALGDAVGELAFRFPDKGALLDEVGRSRTLIYTDDTAMALGLARSLAEVGDLDQEQLGKRFRRDFEQEPWRG